MRYLSDTSKTVTDSMEETKQRHRRNLRAINNPIRRKVLRSIERGNTNIAAISEDTGTDEKTLSWHLRILEDGFCVERTIDGDQEEYKLTQEGRVVDYLDK